MPRANINLANRSTQEQEKVEYYNAARSKLYDRIGNSQKFAATPIGSVPFPEETGFRVGDLVDVFDPHDSEWVRGTVTKIRHVSRPRDFVVLVVRVDPAHRVRIGGRKATAATNLQRLLNPQPTGPAPQAAPAQPVMLPRPAVPAQPAVPDVTLDANSDAAAAAAPPSVTVAPTPVTSFTPYTQITDPLPQQEAKKHRKGE